MDRKPRRLRLLVVSPYYPAHGGGVEIVAGQLAIGLAGQGLSVTWAASDCDASPADACVECIPMKCINAIERRTGVPVPFWTPGALRQLLQALRRADVVMMHEALYLPNLFAAALARALRKPLVLVQHVGDVPYRARALRLIVTAGNRVAARFVHRCATRVVFISAVVRDYFRGDRPPLAAKALVIANGLEAARFTPALPVDRAAARERLSLPAHRPVMLFVGRFVEKKGLAVIERLARQRPEWLWVFVGAGPMDPQAWRLPQVRVVGRLPQEDLPAWYRAADLLVLPSVGEGFPLVVQEAMACGLPAAVAAQTAHALPGVAERVFSEVVTADVGDTAGRWLALLDRALAGEAAARRGEVARFAREQWSWERCVGAYAGLIEEVSSAGSRDA